MFTPLYFMRLGAPEPVALQFLTLFCAGGVVLQLLTGYMIDRFAPSLVLVICCGLLAAGLALVAQVWEIPLLAWPLMLLLGGVAAAIDTAGLAGINDTFAPAEMPSGTAAFSVLWYVGGLTGPVLAGSAMETWNPHGMPVVVAAVCLALVAANAATLMSAHRAPTLSRQDL